MMTTKSDKIKKFGFLETNVVMLCCDYTDLFTLKREDDSYELSMIASRSGLVKDLAEILCVMNSHPDDDCDYSTLYSLTKSSNPNNIENVVKSLLFSLPDEIIIFASKFDTTKCKVHMHFEMKLYLRDAIKLSDEFINKCTIVSVMTDMGDIQLESNDEQD